MLVGIDKLIRMKYKKENTYSKAPKKAGHRSWAARSASVPGGHAGDIMSPYTRSRLMARIKSVNTGPERIIYARLQRLGFYFARHALDLPGRPDIVLRRLKLAIFIDGDFWHGWRFSLWKHKLSEKWCTKILANRARDVKNFRKLRNLGWKIIRIWEHEVERQPDKCIERILKLRQVLLQQKKTQDIISKDDSYPL
jgi:DNA mismatch endonuclease, patch repair protein